MIRIFSNKKIFFTIALFATITCNVFAFEVELSPENPKGGEAFWVTIEGKNSLSYKVYFGRNKYGAYKINEHKKAVLIPLNIGTEGTKKLTVKEKFLFFTLNKKSLDIDINKRKIEVFRLSKKSEAIRDKQASIPKQKKRINKKKAVRTKKRLWEKGFELPLKGEITTKFSILRKGKKYSYYHMGIDIAAKEGTLVKATNTGRVVFAKKGLNIYGNALIIDHGQGITSVYFHLRKILKQKGDVVYKGQVVAESGNTGWSTGPHLHFGIYAQGQAIDPIWLIKN
ncbi:M23 family metallopeptidase [Elusimicrobiota bacterium]